MKYLNYNYIFPPRPEHKIDPKFLGNFDNGEYVAQPKYNGSCAVIFLHSDGFFKVMNRHGEVMSNVKYDQIDFKSLYKGYGFMVLSGELLNKAKNGEDGKLFNQKFVIWDILVYCGETLVGSSFPERMRILSKLYPNAGPDSEYKHLISTVINGVYRAPVYQKNFVSLYEDIAKVDLYEGLVLKRISGKLEIGNRSANNTGWQIKCRKPTKNYKH